MWPNLIQGVGDLFEAFIGRQIGRLMLLVGSVGAWCCIVALRRGRASLDWPCTTGVVIESHVRTDAETPAPYVLFEYTVDGRTFRSDTITHKPIRLTRDIVEDTVRAYPSNTEVLVHYNPTDPAKAVLLPGPASASFLAATMSLCVVLMLAGALFLAGVL